MTNLDNRIETRRVMESIASQYIREGKAAELTLSELLEVLKTHNPDAAKLAGLALEATESAAHWLAMALPYVEDAEDDPAYKPGAVEKLAAQIRAHIEG